MLEKFFILKDQYNKLMYERYGKVDSLNKALLVTWFFTGFLNLFFHSILVGFIVPAFFFLAVFRFMSKNTVQRLAENRRYKKYADKISAFFKIQYKRIAEYKTHRYYKCINCKAYIRVPAKKGKHTISCPKCGKEFDVKVR